MKGFSAGLVVAAAAICGGCQGLENRVVYFPTHTPEPPAGPDGIPLTPESAHRRAYLVDFVTADGTRIHAWWCPCPGAGGAVLFCHGNAGDLTTWAGTVAQMMDGVKESVLVFDYPGFGRSGGQPSEAGCYAAADAAYEWLRASGVAAERITIFGISLGGGVAVDLASRRPARALVLVKTFTSVPDVAEHVLAGVPAGWVMSNRFDSAAKIGRCPQPVFVAAGTDDRLIPYRDGVRLYEAATSPKSFFPLEGSDHNDSLPPRFFAAVGRFLAAPR
jgi:fermentation-respiration switch protein FrsA (DUF1100 family)